MRNLSMRASFLSEITSVCHTTLPFSPCAYIASKMKEPGYEGWRRPGQYLSKDYCRSVTDDTHQKFK